MLRICRRQIHYDIDWDKLWKFFVAFRKVPFYLQRVMQITVLNKTAWWWPVDQSTAGLLH